MGNLMWAPPVELTAHEEGICRRLKRVGRFFAFLRRHRHELFNEELQQDLAVMYSDTPRGTPPKPPALLATVTLLQAYEQKSDAAAVEEAVFDQRWQMVLDCLGCDSPPFSQGGLVEFRRRLIEHNLDRRLIERTVQMAEESGEFGAKHLRVALDSAPLWGAGRVEDTFNLIGHALSVVVECAARVWGRKPCEVEEAAGLEVVGEASVKAMLDIDWTDQEEQQGALRRLLIDVDRLRTWISTTIDECDDVPLQEALELLAQVVEQDIEPDPDGSGPRIRRGVATNRRISIRDPDMRHGRKSKSRVINGYKRHVGTDLSSGFILAAAVRPANEREHLAMDDELRPELEAYGPVEELHIDRGYLAGSWVKELDAEGKRVISKAWDQSRAGRFSKAKFDIDLDEGRVICPAGRSTPIRGSKAQFSRTDCGSCSLRHRCTKAAYRSVAIHPLERLLQQYRRDAKTSEGRAERRQRVDVEHSLAHVTRRQGPRSRYIGQRKNLFDLRRTVAVENLNRLALLARRAA
jgi:hypothetical protein